MQGCVLMVQMKKLRRPSESGHRLNRLWYYFLDMSPASICKQTSSSPFATYHKMVNTNGKPVRDCLLITALVTPAGWPACLHTAGVERGLQVVTARSRQVNRSSWWHNVFQRKSQQQNKVAQLIGSLKPCFTNILTLLIYYWEWDQTSSMVNTGIIQQFIISLCLPLRNLAFVVHFPIFQEPSLVNKPGPAKATGYWSCVGLG